MRDYLQEALSHDPIHGYIPFTTGAGLLAEEVSERQLIDHPWVQRMRQIHQLQTAWWVFPSAEHTRFQHVMGAMHLASRAVAALYESLREVCSDVPSRGCVESLMRVAALLHDVGHGPFGHFFDEHFLVGYGLNHETLGSVIIREQLGPLIRGIRRNPNSELTPQEQLDPEQITYLITRPKSDTSTNLGSRTRESLGMDQPTQAENLTTSATVGNSQLERKEAPRWLRFLRSLFSGLYTVDNMDFVLRDAYMSGYSTRAFDLERLLHYSFFSDAGLTIHVRGLPALVRFIGIRAELFRSLYFHRTVRAIDLTLADLFAESKDYLLPGNPLEHLDEYRQFTEWSLLVDVGRWTVSQDPRQRELGQRWNKFLGRSIRWKMAAERTVFFDPTAAEHGSIFSNEFFFEQAIREQLPVELRALPLRVDLPRHVHRPGTRGPSGGQNFLFDPARGCTVPLSSSELFRQIPLSYRICRVYAESSAHNTALSTALDHLVGPGGSDDRTNM